MPIYKYLRELGINNDEEYNNNPLGLNFSLPKSTDFASYKSFSSEEKKFSLQQAISVFLGKEKWKAVALIPDLEVSSETDLSLLKQFISDNLVDFLVRNNSYSTYMRKLICFYDCVKYGWRG